MQKRLIVAVGLSMFILVLFQQMQSQNAAVDKQENKTETETVTESVAVDKEETASTEKDRPYSSEQSPSKKGEFKTVEISDNNLTLTINSVDSGLTGLVMKDKDGSMVQLIRDTEVSSYPLSLDPGVNGVWNIYATGKNSARAEISDGNISAVREYRITNKGRISIVNRIKNISDMTREVELNQGWTGGLATTGDLKEENFSKNRLFAKIDGKVKGELKEKSYGGRISWAGIVNRYFMVALLDIEEPFNSVETFNLDKKSKGCSSSDSDGANFPEISLKGRVEISPGREFTFSQNIYAGLKEYKVLKNLDEDMDEILSFGIFGFLSRIFLAILIWFQALVGNYGLAIIMLTFLLQIFIFPLTIKSFKSMQSMKDLQPKMTKIREKFKDDAQRMNQEIMALYKKNKVNPFGGCFPLLLQMPIFISLFTMLRSVAELRYSTFLWIKDLARQDVLFASVPLIKDIPYIGSAGPLPFLMGGAMFLQQKLTGGTEGPQKNLTYIMPVVFTFLFMRFPSGLVLYWLTNSILTFLIQSVISKKNN
jgi:YidC/Oxa1 family membrane protein insertase